MGVDYLVDVHHELNNTLRAAFTTALTSVAAGVPGLHVSSAGGMWLDWDGAGTVGYWAYVGISGLFDRLPEDWPTHLTVTWVDGREDVSPSETVVSLQMVPRDSLNTRDEELMAAFTVGAVVLDHKRRETR